MTGYKEKQFIKIEPIEAFQDNYIWLIHNDQNCIVIDPGDANPVIEVLNTTSPTDTPSAPMAVPRNTVPSSSTSRADLVKITSKQQKTGVKCCCFTTRFDPEIVYSVLPRQTCLF